MSMERDDLIEYSLYNHHGEEEGKKIRKKIYKVTFIMTVITLIELGFGIFAGKAVVGIDTTTWQMIKILYVSLTIVKAGYIVMSFMHLGDEKRAFKWVILAPYVLFILYLVFICLTEGVYVNSVWQSVK
jgi:cytochrome c oxidase subunit 4